MLPVIVRTQNRLLRILDCGIADYRTILDQQQQLHQQRRREQIPNTVLIAEHHPVITLGARKGTNELLVSRGELAEKHIDIIDVRRGGGPTAHNPGQLVVYPILHLPDFGFGINEYIRKLEAIGAELLAELAVRAETRKGFPGLWAGAASSSRNESRISTPAKKIASVGVRASRSVTYHGMAINIQNDLSIFDLFIPCGLKDVETTSVLKETGRRCPMSQVKQKLTELLVRHFSPADSQTCQQKLRRLPPWLRRPLPAGGNYARTENVLNSLGLETICANANCPNRGECWNRGTATVLILGNICTRNCRFCAVATGKPAPADPTEPQRIARMVRQMGLKYLVLTSVSRDDLPLGGADHFRNCINELKRQCPDLKCEILTPDFRGCQAKAIRILADALPFVFAHNVETVPALYPKVRPGGNYQRSLNLLRMVKRAYPEMQTKSSIMLGLGETDRQVRQVLKDLRNVGCDRITIGQYLKPAKSSLEVAEYVRPEKFDRLKQKAIQLGFSWVCAVPFARSSYFAEQKSSPQNLALGCVR